METTIKWGSGYLILEPAFPDSLRKKLKYWRMTLNWSEEQFRRVASGAYEEQYTIDTWIDPNTQQFNQRLTTLPGFLHRIKKVLIEEGWTYKIIDERQPMPPVDLMAACGTLRPYQLECAYTALMSGGGVIACPTGWGKTHIMAAICKAFNPEELKMRGTPLTVVTTPDKDITEKDFNDLKKLLPGREVGLVMSGKNKFVDDVQVITLDSLHRINPAEVGVLICDEVHTAAANTRSKSILAMRNAAKWGVSATPDGRFDGRDLVTEGLFGPVVYSRTYQQGVKDGALVPITVYWVEVPEPSIGIEKYLKYTSRDGRYRQGVWRNAARNELIGEIMRRLPRNMQTLCIMQYLDHMDEMLPYCGDEVYQVHGQQDEKGIEKLPNVHPISSKQRKEIYKKMESTEIMRILSTHVYKQGVNFPNLEVVINAGGGGSDIVAKQIPGRESRKTDTKQRSYLIDFWHPWDKTHDARKRLVAGSVHTDDHAREKCYTELGFDQVWIKDLTQLPLLQ